MCIATGTATGTVETADTAGADIDNTVINDGRTDAEFSGNVKSAAVDGCYVERYASGSGFHRYCLLIPGFKSLKEATKSTKSNLV